MNSVILIGRTTDDPKVTYGNEMCIAKFKLAVNRTKKDEADFLSCVAFGKTAQIIEKYVHKGDRVGLEGRIQTGSYAKADGTKVYTTDIVINQLELLEKKNTSAKESTTAQNSTPPGYQQEEFVAVADSMNDIGLPFM